MSALEKTALVAKLANNKSARAEYARGMAGYVPLFPE